MKRGLPMALAVLFAIACNSSDEARKPGAEPKSAPPVEPASKVQKGAVPPRGHDPALTSLLSRLKYKPDPYETQPGCISEPKSQKRERFVLWVALSLQREGSAITVKDTKYTVSTQGALPPEETPESEGIPRLVLVHRDGLTTHSDFAGSYREPGSDTEQLTSQATPRDPTWVNTWLASAEIDADVTAHRITLDGRVLKEVKRPDESPVLSSIECDDTSAQGLKLAWRASHPNAEVPLLVEVLRSDQGGFVELLPTTAARDVNGFTLAPAEQQAPSDLVLLVALTDTFRFVTRGVLIPRKAL